MAHYIILKCQMFGLFGSKLQSSFYQNNVCIDVIKLLHQPNFVVVELSFFLIERKQRI